MNRYFGLRKIAPLVESYAFPDGAFDPSGSWNHTYRILTMAYSRLASSGTLNIVREPRAGGEVSLGFRIARPAVSGFTHFTHAEMVCRADAMATPLRWKTSTKIARSWSETGYLHSEMTKTAQSEGESIVFTCGSAIERVAVSGAATCRYNLIEALQRAVPGSFDPVRFCCMDEFDEPSSGHRLEFRETEPLSIGHETRKLNLFIHTGSGVIPSEYWVDGSGRVLFMISGIEALVLENANGQPISFRRDAKIFDEAAQSVQEGR
jgi:hypothetical protein